MVLESSREAPNRATKEYPVTWRRVACMLPGHRPDNRRRPPGARFMALSWMKPRLDGGTEAAAVIICRDTVDVQAHGGSSAARASYAIDRLAQVDVAADELQLLFFRTDHVLDLLWLRCGDDDECSPIALSCSAGGST